MNANPFDPDDYALQISNAFVGHKLCFIWRVNLYGMPLECRRGYATKRGAMKAGKEWLKKYIHEHD